MAFDLIAEIRKKSREEWVQFFRDKWLDTRILIQENGEFSLIAGIVFGILFVIGFRFFVAIGVIAVLAVVAILKIAEPRPQGAEKPEPAKSSISVNGGPKENDRG